MSDTQNQLQGLSDDYQKLQTGLCPQLTVILLPYQLIGSLILELEETVAAREKLESQRQENKSVQKVYDPEDLPGSLHNAHGTQNGPTGVLLPR